jgi:hypothetical protein
MCTLNGLVHLTTLKIPLSNQLLSKNTKAKECRRDAWERSSLFLCVFKGGCLQLNVVENQTIVRSSVPTRQGAENNAGH